VEHEDRGAEFGVAQDATTITEVVAELEAAGHEGQFIARAGGELECLTCRRHVDAAAVGNFDMRRLEGASDPDDMLAVVGLACPACGARGTVVLNYGPTASADDAEVLERLEDPRRSGH
jgi:hypothetical protein